MAKQRLVLIRDDHPTIKGLVGLSLLNQNSKSRTDDWKRHEKTSSWEARFKPDNVHISFYPCKDCFDDWTQKKWKENHLVHIFFTVKMFII